MSSDTGQGSGMRRALLDAIAAAPDDDGPRLVYSDWLLERGDPLGELIVVQCELARTGSTGERAAKLRARARELERAHARTWLYELERLSPGARWQWRFERGFLAELTFRNGTRLRDAEVVPLAASELLFLLERLSLPGHEIGEEGARAIAASPRLTRLVALELSGNPLGPGSLAALAGSSTLGRLAELDLRSSGIGDDEVALPRELGLPGLQRLRLGGNSISGRLIEALAGWLARLEHLSINAWIAPGSRYLLAPGDNLDFHLKGLTALAASPLDHLRVLQLGRCAFGDAGIERLCRARSLGSLETLALDSTDIGDAGIAALCAAAPRLPALVHLDLWDNPIGDAGARALCESPFASRLETLEAGRWERPDPHGGTEVWLTAAGRAMLQDTFGDRLRISESHP